MVAHWSQIMGCDGRSQTCNKRTVVSQKCEPDDLYGATCSRPDNSFSTNAWLEYWLHSYPNGQRLDYIMYNANHGTLKPRSHDYFHISVAIAINGPETNSFRYHFSVVVEIVPCENHSHGAIQLNSCDKKSRSQSHRVNEPLSKWDIWHRMSRADVILSYCLDFVIDSHQSSSLSHFPTNFDLGNKLMFPKFLRKRILLKLEYLTVTGQEVTCDKSFLSMTKIPGVEYNYSDHEGVTAWLQVQATTRGTSQQIVHFLKLFF